MVVVAALGGGCDSGGGGGNAPDPTVVTASLSEYAIALDAATVPAGDVTFDIDNKGMMIHELVVVKTDFTPATMPTASDGSADEEAAGVTAVDEVEGIQPGASAELDVTLSSGHYVVLCNIGDHFAKGMATELTVQ